MNVAALDVGSNSFHLVVVEVEGGQQLRLVDRAREMVRIGEGTLNTRVIPTDAFERGMDALVHLKAVADRHQPEALLAVATAALREAHNGDRFVRAAREIGIDLRIIDAHEEARLVYLGARRALNLGERGERRVALFDLGGGSLEIIVADGCRMYFTASLPLGGLRLAQREPCGDSASLAAHIRGELTSTIQRVEQIGYDFIAFAAGTADAIRAILHAQQGKERTAPIQVTLAQLAGLERDLAALSPAEKMQVPGLDPRRLDSIVPGTTVLRTVLELTGRAEATFATGNIRDGLIADYLERRASVLWTRP